MAQKKSTSFTDRSVGLDDFQLDLDDFMEGGSTGNKKQDKKRRPITKVATNFGKGAASHFYSEGFIRQTLKAGLPQGYGVAIETGFEIRDNAAQLYNTASQEWRKTEPALRRAVGRMLPKEGKILSKRLTQKLRNFAEGGIKSGPASNPDEDTIREALGELQGMDMEQRARDRAEDMAMNELQQQVDKRRFNVQVKALASIDARLARMNAFNDQVFSRFQRRSLELQYRSYFTLRDTQKLLGAELGQTRQLLQAIVHNTALPDSVKGKMREKYGEGLRERLSGYSQQAVADFTRNYWRNLQGRLSGGVRNMFSGAQSFLQGGDMAADQIEMMRSMGMDVGAESSKMMGQGIMSLLANLAAQNVQGTFRRGGWTAQRGAKLGRVATNLPDMLTDWATSQTDTSSFKGRALQWFKDQFPRKNINRRLGGAAIMEAGDPGMITKRFQRSVEEVMPGYLSRILHELTQMRTGQTIDDKHRMVYNEERNDFTSKGGLHEDMRKRLYSSRQMQAGREHIKDLADRMFAGRTVSPELHAAMQKQLMADVMSGKGLNVKQFLQRGGDLKHVPPELRAEMRKAMSGRFKGRNGRTDQVTLEDLTRRYNQARSTLPDIRGVASAYFDSGHTDFLHDEGLLEKYDDTYLINHDATVGKMGALVGEGPQTSRYSRDEPEYVMSGAGATMAERFSDQRTDLYRPGQMDKPVVTRDDIYNGKFTSSETGRPVMLMRHILGGLMLGGRPYLTPSQCARLVTANGETLPDYLKRTQVTRKRSKLGQVWDKHVRDFGGRVDEAGAFAEGKLKAARKATKGKRQHLRDWMRGKRQRTADYVNDLDARAASAMTPGTSEHAAVMNALAQGKTTLSTATGTAKQQLNHLGGVIAGKTQPLRSKTARKLRKAWKRAMKTSQYAIDLYRNGELVPTIKAEALKSGEYVSAQTGKVITDMRQIVEGVKDKHGNWIVSPQEAMTELRVQGGEQFARLVDQTQQTLEAAKETAAGQAVVAASATVSQTLQPMTSKVTSATQRVLPNILQAAHQAASPVTGAPAPVAVAEDDPLVKTIEAFREGNFERLEAIQAAVLAGLPEGKVTVVKGQRKPGVLRRGLGNLATGVGAYFKGFGKLYSGVGSGVRSAAGWLFGGRGGKGVNNLSTKPSDIYVRGEHMPRLTKGAMKAGQYFNEDGTPITALADIKGAVKDAEGNYLLSKEDFDKGLLDATGKPVLKKLWHAVGTIGGALGGYYANVIRAFGATAGLIANTIKMAATMHNKPVDIYLPGDLSKPRLTANGMRAGIYVDAKHPKKVIKGPEDIKGAVLDISKNPPEQVLSLEEYSQGLVNIKGKPITQGHGRLGKLLGGGLDLATMFGQGYLKLIGHMGRAGFALAGAPFRLLHRMLGGGKGGKGFGPHDKVPTADQQTHHLLEEVLHLLDARLPENEHMRAGSWQEEFAKRQKQREAQAKQGSAGTTGARKGLFGRLKDMFRRKKQDEDSSGGLGVGDINIGGAAKTAEKEAKEAGRLARWGGKAKGWIGKSKVGRSILAGAEKLGGSRVGQIGGRVLGGAGRAVGGLGKTAWNIGKLALGAGSLAEVGGAAASALGGVGSVIGGAASAIGGGLATAAGAIGSVLSAPVLLAGAAVAAVGTAAYFGFKYYNLKKKAPLRKLRMAQYGVDMNDNVWPAGKIQKLEAMLEPHTTVVNGKGQIDTKDLDEKAILKIFDLAKSWYNPLGWFHKTTAEDVQENAEFFKWLANRFKPVYFAWKQALHEISAKTGLGEADDLPKEKKAQLLKQVMAVDSSVYDIANSPFRDDPIVTGKKLVDAAYAEAMKDVGDKQGKDGKKKSLLSRIGSTALAMVTAPAKLLLSAGKGAAGLMAKGAKAGWNALKKMGQYLETKFPKATDALKKATSAFLGATGLGWAFKVAGSALSAFFSSRKNRQYPDKKVSALMAIRYKTYGLVDMHAEPVKALFLLETDVLDKVTYDKEGNAQFDEDPTFYLKEYAPNFGISSTDEKATAQWLAWFSKRFLPTLLQFASAVKHLNKSSDPRDADDFLSPQHKLDVANLIVAAVWKEGKDTVSVWKFDQSPFTDQPINTDATSVKGNIEAIRQEVRTQVLAEQKAGVEAKKQAIAQAAKPQASTGSSTTTLPPAAKFKLPPGVEAGSAAAQRFAATGSTTLNPQGQAIRQPGHGTGGDITKLPQVNGSGLSAIMPLLQAAGRMAGVDPGVLATFAGIESSYNPSAQAPTSSAAGLFQFINSTWKAMLSRYAGKYGIDPRTPQTDPRAAALMGAEYIKENQRQLAQVLGRAPTDTELYLAHFLGPGGAASMLKANPGAIAAAVNPAAAQANASIFYNKGMPRTVAQVMQVLNGKVGKFRDKGGALAKADSSPLTGGNTTTTANGPTGGLGGRSTLSGTAQADVAGARALAALTPPGGKPKPFVPAMGMGGDAPDTVAGPDPVRVNREARMRQAAAADAQAQSFSRDHQQRAAELKAVADQQLKVQQGILATLQEMLGHTSALPGMAKVVGDPTDRDSMASATPPGIEGTGARRPPQGAPRVAPVSMRATDYGSPAPSQDRGW